MWRFRKNLPEVQGNPGGVPSARQGTALQGTRNALVLLVVGLIATALTALFFKSNVESAAQKEFDSTCIATTNILENRLSSSALILHSGVALFDASGTVSREEWKTFIQRLQLEEHVRGIQGTGFALLMPGEDMAAHLAELHGQGFPDYAIYPAGERDVFSSIIYLEPFSGRNLRAFGYDMLTEPVRRDAMERARDESRIALSGKVTLVQESSEDVQAGTLMYAPVYRHGASIDTVEQRRDALQGWVYSAYRMTDMIRGALVGTVQGSGDKRFIMQVYDGEILSAENLLYDDGWPTPGIVPEGTLTRLTTLDFGGRRWTIGYSHPGGMAAFADYGSVELVILSGAITSVSLFFLLIWRKQRIRFTYERLVSGQALQKIESMFQSTFEQAAVGMALVGLDGRFLRLNRKFCDVVGYGYDELLQLTFQDITYPADLDVDLSSLSQLVDGIVSSYSLEKRYIRKDRSIVWVNLTVGLVLDEIGEPEHFISVIEDITARKQAVMDLRIKNSVFENSIAAQSIADKAGIIQHVNAAFLHLWGYPDQAHAVGNSVGSFFADPSDAAPVMEALVHQNAWEGEFLARRVDGSTFISRGYASSLRDPSGELQGYQSTNLDVSPLHDAENRFRSLSEHLEQLVDQRTTELKEVNRELDAFSYSVSHDLKAPLRAVDGYARMLEEDYAVLLDVEGKRLLGVIRDNARGMGQLINDLLTFSRLSRTELKRSRIDMQSMVTRVIEEVVADAPGRNIRWEIGILPPSYGDAATVHQVLINVLANAVKFTRRRTEAIIGVSGYADGNDSIYAVSDNGAGFDMAYKDKLFNVFQRLHTADEFEGTGIGLALVQRIILRHGGRVWAEGGLNEGATFHFTLPGPAHIKKEDEA